MGNEFSEENETKEKEPIDKSDSFIKYGIISKKWEESSIQDSFLAFSNLQSSKESTNKIHFGLYGVFDGHNNDYVAKYLSKNCKEIFEKEAGDINKDNYSEKIEGIFKTLDKNLRKEGKKAGDDNNIKNVNIDINEKEIKFYKELIQNTKEIPEDLKNVEDSQIRDVLLFRDLFKYNNNYLYSNNDTDYIGSSASIVLINNENIITADLGITACILFNKEGKIINKNKDPKDLLNSEHVFENKKEKKRIKKFNEDVDFESLKYNIYLPTSRCFGLFKYKADEILNEENQIISCVPDVNYYSPDSVDYILLMTKGMINLLKDNLEQFIQDLAKEFQSNKDIKISELLNTYINNKIEDFEKKEEKEENNVTDKGETPTTTGKNNSIYIGKEDFGEENEIINELKKNYYKDVMDMNKNNCYNCHDKYNITCILMKLTHELYPVIEVTTDDGNKVDEKIKDKEKDNIQNIKIEQSKNEIVKNEIEDINIDKEKDKLSEKKEENIAKEKKDEKKEDNKNEIKNENPEEKKEEKKEEKCEEKKEEIKEDTDKIEEKKIEDEKLNIDEENKNKEEKKEEKNDEKKEEN